MKKSEMINHMKETAIREYNDLKDAKVQCGVGSVKANYFRTRWMLADRLCFEMGIKVDYKL